MKPMGSRVNGRLDNPLLLVDDYRLAPFCLMPYVLWHFFHSGNVGIDNLITIATITGNTVRIRENE